MKPSQRTLLLLVVGAFATSPAAAAEPTGEPPAGPPAAPAAEAATFRNPFIDANLSDPSVLLHEGVYYLHATGDVQVSQ